jgi:hypothetical protein
MGFWGFGEQYVTERTSANSYVLLPPLACAPCYERTCPLGHTRCLEDVQAERVYALL